MGTGEKMKKENPVVMVTGATRGLGFHVAERFRNSSHDIVLVARNIVEMEKTKKHLLSDQKDNNRVHCFEFDLGNIPQIPDLMKNVSEIAGNPGILVNNAAIQGPIGPFPENGWEEWIECMNVCLVAPVRLCQLALPAMIEHRYGRIVNISGGGATAPRPGFTSYATAKCGLVRFSETLAKEVQPYNITVNCIAPGIMQSNLTKQILNAGTLNAGTDEYKTALRLMNENPHTEINAADLVHFITTDTCNEITGKLISAVWDPWPSLPGLTAKLRNTDIYTLRRIIPEDRGSHFK